MIHIFILKLTYSTKSPASKGVPWSSSETEDVGRHCIISARKIESRTIRIM
jgi:hypothetical protein